MRDPKVLYPAPASIPERAVVNRVLLTFRNRCGEYRGGDSGVEGFQEELQLVLGYRVGNA